MTKETDANGNYHDENGRFVSLRDYVERIFDEREAATEFARATLERALIEARSTTEKAMNEAKVAADERTTTITTRLDKLESGGAPFASRLDDGLSALKDDVEALKENMVRTDALDGLRKQNTAAIEQQRKQIRLVVFAAIVNFGLGAVLVAIQLLR